MSATKRKSFSSVGYGPRGGKCLDDAKTPKELLDKLVTSYKKYYGESKSPMSALVVSELALSIAAMVSSVSRSTGDFKDYGLNVEETTNAA